MLTNQKFFDAVSDSYDNMILFNEAVEKKKKYLKEFISSEIQSAADLGCGTGVDSIALYKLGINVTAFDISKGMIDKAKQNAEKEKAEINFINKSITEIEHENYDKYDFIISLGNSLGNLDEQQLNLSVSIIKNMLRKNGSVVIQILNYIPVLEKKERIINITSDDNFNFVRFYDFKEDYLQFNILKYSIQNPKDNQIISTKIYPHKYNYINNLLKQSGFRKINMYGGLDKSSFSESTSKDLVIHAEV